MNVYSAPDTKKQMKLAKLSPAGRKQVDDSFLAGRSDTLEVEDRHVEPLETAVDCTDARNVLDDIASRFKRYDSNMDRGLAAAFHEALPMPRSVAAQKGVWHYLAVVVFPGFVRHRWKPESGKVSKERFLGSLKRNTFSRLWWGAELTAQDGGDYSMTNRLFSAGGVQDLYEAAFGRNFSYYQPALFAFIQVLSGKSRETIREAAKMQSQLLTTLVLETVTQEALEERLRHIVEQVERRSDYG